MTELIPSQPDPGKPFYKRPIIVGLILLVAIAGAIVLGITVLSDPLDQAKHAGKCADSNGSGVVFFPCSQPHKFKVLKAVDDKADCPAETLIVVDEEGGRRLASATGPFYCIGLP